MRIRNLLISAVFCILAGPSMAQVATLDESGRVELNQQLAYTNRRLLEAEGAISLSGDRISGILPLSKGGLNNALTDPGADRIYFWDDSEGETDWLTLGNGLTITTTTLAVNEVDLDIPVFVYKNPMTGTAASCTGVACNDSETDIIDSRTDWLGKRLSFEGSISIYNDSFTPAQDDIDDIESTSTTAVTGYPYAVSGDNSKQVYKKFFWTASTTNKSLGNVSGVVGAGDVTCELDVNGSGQLVLVTTLVGTTGGGNGGHCRLDDIIIIREP